MLAGKKTMTLNLTDAEMAVLDELCAKKDLSKTAVLRQALRLFRRVDEQLEKGEKLFFENPATQGRTEVLML